MHAALYAIASGTALLALTVCWQGPGRELLRVEGPTALILHGALLAGIAGFLWSAHALRSFDSLGLGALRRAGDWAEPAESRFVARGPYRWVRHPFYSSALLILWSAPVLTADRLLLNLLFSAWIVAGARLEERDLLLDFGEPYAVYRQQVPMLIPWRAPLRRGANP
jgi:protein-S-isoprenylcysteine O-methyltransferase Ste14